MNSATTLKNHHHDAPERSRDDTDTESFPFDALSFSPPAPPSLGGGINTNTQEPVNVTSLVMEVKKEDM